MAPHYEQAAAQLEPKVRLLKLDADASPEITSRYAVRSIPTLLLFNNGNLLAESAGAMTSAQIVQWVRQHAKL
jgi:thioredoxin 2